MGPDELPRQPADQPGGVLDSRPEPRGLNRLIRTGWRREARKRAAVARAPARTMKGRLTVELVPKTSLCDDVGALMEDGTWDRVRRQVDSQAGGRCEICRGDDPGFLLECHEQWRFDDQTRVQTLERMVALCSDCHKVKHIGLAGIHGQGVHARAHLARVNGWTLSETEANIREAFRVWAQRSQGPWTLDLEGLRPYVDPVERARIVRLAMLPPERRRTTS
jgi:hypothetical protein